MKTFPKFHYFARSVESLNLQGFGLTQPKQFYGEVLIRFSPIVGWNFQINLVGSFSFIVFSIYKMIESQPSTLTAANIWIETWLGKKHSNIWKIERQTNVLLNGIVRSKGKSCKKNAFCVNLFPRKCCISMYPTICFVFDIIFAQLCCILKIQSVIWLLSFFEV